MATIGPAGTGEKSVPSYSFGLLGPSVHWFPLRNTRTHDSGIVPILIANMRKRSQANPKAMNPPTRAMLAVFRASIRLMDDDTLAELRGRFIALSEHPTGIRAMDREISRRKRAASKGGFC